MIAYQSVYRVVQHLDPALLTLTHEGTKAYHMPFDLLYRRNAGTPNEMWQADHTLLDLGVQHDIGSPARPWLTVITVIMDDYSRAIAGFEVSFHAPCHPNGLGPAPSDLAQAPPAVA